MNDKPVAHTPGPWEIAPFAEGDECLEVCAGYRTVGDGHKQADWIAELIAENVDGGYARNLANARLIALAPEMFDIVRTVVAICDSGDTNMAELALMENSPLVGECRALLAKARGSV